MIHITEARYISEKKVWLSFDDGASGEIDLTHSLIGPIFEPLKNNTEFAKVYFDEELETIAWPNGADFAPEYLRELLNSQSPSQQYA